MVNNVMFSSNFFSKMYIDKVRHTVIFNLIFKDETVTATLIIIFFYDGEANKT